MVSVIILTKNEELDLPACLTSVTWSDDVHVLDSGSTDRTLEIAREYNAKCWSNPFKSFGDQRNHALDNLVLQYDWILFIDAYEVVTESFQKEMFLAIKNADDSVAGFY